MTKNMSTKKDISKVVKISIEIKRFVGIFKEMKKDTRKDIKKQRKYNNSSNNFLKFKDLHRFKL